MKHGIVLFLLSILDINIAFLYCIIVVLLSRITTQQIYLWFTCIFK